MYTLPTSEAGQDGGTRRSPCLAGLQSGTEGSEDLSLNLCRSSCSRGRRLQLWWGRQRPIQRTGRFQIHTCRKYSRRALPKTSLYLQYTKLHLQLLVLYLSISLSLPTCSHIYSTCMSQNYIHITSVNFYSNTYLWIILQINIWAADSE